MALRIALEELAQLVEDGLSQDEFESIRNYLMKNVFVMTATQDQRLGYALDSDWYGIGEFTTYMRERLSRLSLDEVNRVIRKHLSAENLAVVIVTEDAPGLRDRLVAAEFSVIQYDAPKPAEILEEDERIGALKLDISEDDVVITPVEEVFAE